MTGALSWIAALPLLTVAALGAIYLYSRDPGRRGRALRLITMLRHGARDTAVESPDRPARRPRRRHGSITNR